MKRLGKRAGHILDLIHAPTPTPVHIKELAKLAGIRPNNLRARYISRLLAAGLIEGDETQGYTTPPDIEARLQRELEDSGCVEAERLQKIKHTREQDAYRTRKQNPAGEVMTQDEMDHGRIVRNADGTTEELKHWHVPLTTEEKPRTCKMVNGIAVHNDPLCEFDCSVGFGHTLRTREDAA